MRPERAYADVELKHGDVAIKLKAPVDTGASRSIIQRMREGLDLVIGRPEIDSWDIMFTLEGPRPRKVPIEFEII